MALEQVAREGLVLLGCGKMGSALLAGWLGAGLPATSVWVIEPNPTDWLKGLGVHLNEGVPPAPAVALLAVKPQMMGAALPALQALGNGRTLVVSIAAGTSIAAFEQVFGNRTPIVRTMPNTPAMVGRGITGICYDYGPDPRIFRKLHLHTFFPEYQRKQRYIQRSFSRQPYSYHYGEQFRLQHHTYLYSCFLSGS